jgi:type VI secretion system protein ImpB
LAKLVEARRRLSNLMSKLEGNDKLNDLLQEVIGSTDALQKLGKEAGIEKSEEEQKK